VEQNRALVQQLYGFGLDQNENERLAKDLLEHDCWLNGLGQNKVYCSMSI
jgi:hypothetical protein